MCDYDLPPKAEMADDEYSDTSEFAYEEEFDESPSPSEDESVDESPINRMTSHSPSPHGSLYHGHRSPVKRFKSSRSRRLKSSIAPTPNGTGPYANDLAPRPLVVYHPKMLPSKHFNMTVNSMTR